MNKRKTEKDLSAILFSPIFWLAVAYSVLTNMLTFYAKFYFELNIHFCKKMRFIIDTLQLNYIIILQPLAVLRPKKLTFY